MCKLCIKKDPFYWSESKWKNKKNEWIYVWKGKYGWMDGWQRQLCFNTSSVSGLDASSICSGRRGSDMLTTKSCNKKYPITIPSLHNDHISTSLIMELLIICCLSIIILIHVHTCIYLRTSNYPKVVGSIPAGGSDFFWVFIYTWYKANTFLISRNFSNLRAFN